MQELPILNVTDFKPFLNQVFQIQFEKDKILEATLLEINEHPPIEGIERVPFTLIFRTAQKDSYYLQNTFTLEHPNHGSLPLFLIPIGPDEMGMKYQAIFN